MRRLIFLILISSLPMLSHAQSNVVAAEYFFDTDPGVGAATALPAFTASPNLDVNFLAASSGLAQGMHILGIRVRDVANVWSIPVYLPVYILANSPNIVAAEYFFDTDPGSGSATPISVTAGATIDVTFAANSSALAVGMHVMGVRTRNPTGNWSIPSYVPFYIDRSRTITKLEYYFDTDPGSGNATTITVTPPTDLLDQIYSMNSSALALGTHTLNVRVAGQNNFWSIPETVSFTVVVPPPPPTISSFAPTSGIIGTTVTITGTNFDVVAANNTVTFNGISATVTASTATTITTTVPVGASTGPIAVTVLSNTATSSTNFIVCPAAPVVVPNSGCQNTSIAITASGGINGQYRWYTTATGGTALAGETNSNYTTPVLTSTTTYFVSIDNGTCESARTSVTATIIPLPSAPTTTSASACGPSSITLNASGGTNGQYRWYAVATGGTTIAGEVNNTYITPSLTTTTTYYVAINNGTCESTRTAVTATINPLPSAPTTTGATVCNPSTATLNASGGTSGQYRWYTVSTGGTAISGQTNSSFTTPTITATTIYYVAINNGTCESLRTAVTATVSGPCNQPPVITTTSVQTVVEGSVTIKITDLLSDPDNNLDLSTLKIVVQPKSGASASIDGSFNLIINYTGVSFAGLDELTLEVCDLSGACVQQKFSIEVIGDIIVYNAISPNGDNKNPNFILRYIEVLAETKNNKVSIFNRWGDMVWEGVDYNNTSMVFSGLNNNGGELPSGTYFYKIEFGSGRKTETGYLSLRK
jgi:gliding motility-associated-like protein